MRCALLVGGLVTALFVVGTLAGPTASSETVEPGKPGNVSVRSAAESYAKYCASCHGRDGRSKTFKAKSNHARNLTEPEWQERVSDERIFNSIMNGKGKMPAYGKKLTEQEIDLLVAYVRGLRK
jgi:mono/diheme cytochrome c family protein